MQLGIGVNLFKRQKKEGVPVRDGLVAEYLFDEGRGQVLCDYSGKGNHGRLGSTRDADTNDPLWTPQGLSFDGVDDYVNCGSDPSLKVTDGSYTFEAVVMHLVQPPQAANYFWVVGKTGWDMGLALRTNWGGNADRARWILRAYDGENKPHTAPVNYDSFDDYGKYVSITGVYDALDGALLIYVGYTLCCTISMPSHRAYPASTYIGSPGGNTLFFNGEIPLARIYNRALSPEEVQQNHEWSKTELAKRGVNLE